jgi:DNA-binding response OmpR family regulator
MTIRVLIVDDEPDILLMLRLTLEAEGFETALAADGEKALEQLNAASFDVMLLDVMMPVMDGWGVLERLPEIPSAPPVIVVSAKSAAEDVARAKQLGAHDYVTKPFAFPDLKRVIDEATAHLRAG